MTCREIACDVEMVNHMCVSHFDFSSYIVVMHMGHVVQNVSLDICGQ